MLTLGDTGLCPFVITIIMGSESSTTIFITMKKQIIQTGIPPVASSLEIILSLNSYFWFLAVFAACFAVNIKNKAKAKFKLTIE